MGSTRLPGKVLADLGGRPLLGFMLDRLTALEVDHLVVATSDLDRDDPVVALATSSGADVVRGPEADVLARFVLALERFPADTVVRLTADCPLVDPALIGLVVATHRRRHADYTTNVLPRTFPRGLDVEVVTADSLRTAADEAVDSSEREHVTPFVYRRPERFTLANVRSGRLLGDERWTVDTHADLERLRQIVSHLGNLSSGWREVLAAAGTTAPRRSGVDLRLATETDLDYLLELRNDPGVVEVSRTGRVDPAHHRTWFSEALDDPAARLWVGQLDGTDIGYLRTEVEAGTATISIALHPDHRGRGLGRDLLSAHQQRLQEDQQVTRVIAEVGSSNTASRRSFEAAGYLLSEESSGWTIYEWRRG